MQIKFTPFRCRQAYALILTMIFLGVLLTVFASMMYWISTNANVIQRNNQYNMSKAAAEAATERALATMMRDFLSQSLTNASYYAGLTIGQTNANGTPWPVQYVLSDANGVTNQISVLAGTVQSQLQPVGSEYANLMGFPWFWTNIATATPIGQPFTVPATVKQVINFASVPLFQYAIFYNINLEIDPGGVMPINGPVFSNAGIWAGSSSLTFNSYVSAVNQASTATADPFLYTKTGSGTPTFNLTGQPTSGNTAVVMPIAGATNSNPTNVEAILNIPPATYAMGTAAAYSTNGQIYLANEADLIISNAYYGTNTVTPVGTNIISIWYQDSGNTPYLTPITPDFYRLKTAAVTGLYTNYISPYLSDTNRCYTNVAYAGWSFVTNVAFFDYREGDVAQAVQINVGLFNVWVTNQLKSTFGGNYSTTCNGDKGHTIDSIWVYNSVVRDYSTFPAVRVFNGIQLANSWGFTVATPMPLYVYGDYNKQINSTYVSSGTNTANTYPAALMGDSVTILSANWNDGYSLANQAVNSTTLANRTPVNTTVNAACLEGIVQSFTNTSTSTYYYSGGVENFMRLLENWNPGTAYTLTYNGSIVVMFPSIIATNVWNGNYYSIPTRNWGFDFNYLQQAKLPPLTPQAKKLVRWSWYGR